MPMIRIVNIRNENVSHIMQIAVEGPIGRQYARLEDVTQNVYTFIFGQLHSFTTFLKNNQVRIG